MKHIITFVGENSDIEQQKEGKVTAIFSTFTLSHYISLWRYIYKKNGVYWLREMGNACSE